MKVSKNSDNYLIELTQTEINHIEKNKLIIKVDNVKDSYDFSNAEENIFTTEKYPMALDCKKFKLVLDKEKDLNRPNCDLNNYNNSPLIMFILNIFVNLIYVCFIVLLAKILFDNGIEKKLVICFSCVLCTISFVNILIALVSLVCFKENKQLNDENSNEMVEKQNGAFEKQKRMVYIPTIINIGFLMVFALIIIINKIGG